MSSGRSAAWLARLVRDQEAGGSNPLAPTILFESTIYITRKSEERLVAGQELERSNPPTPSIISPLDSYHYAAFSTASSTSLNGQHGQVPWFCLEFGSPGMVRHQGSWTPQLLPTCFRPSVSYLLESGRQMDFCGKRVFRQGGLLPDCP